MSELPEPREFQIQRGNDLYTLDESSSADGGFWGSVSVIKGYRPNAGVFEGTPFKELRGPSLEEPEAAFRKIVDQAAPEAAPEGIPGNEII